MENFNPITLSELYEEIQRSYHDLKGELLNFWQLIRIEPTKWLEKNYSINGEGFWVIAICGRKIIWYNDIEGGFNISNYEIPGSFAEYLCEQDELSWSVAKLYTLIKIGGELPNQIGPPTLLF